MTLEHTTPRPAAAAVAPERRPRRTPIAGPILLIGLGLLFLAQNFGLVSADIWLNLWRFWPLLLVLAGIDLIFSRSGWGVVIAVLLAILLIGSFIAAAVVTPWTGRLGVGPWTFSVAAPVVTEQLAEDLGSAQRADIRLEHGAGTLQIGALPESSPRLIDAALAHPDSMRVESAVNRSGDSVTVDIESKGDAGDWVVGSVGRDDWTLNLTPRAPLNLTVESGASDLRLDLRDLQVATLDVKAGASSAEIILPAETRQTDARVRAGAASVEITVPEGVAARIDAKGGLSGVSIDANRFPHQGGTIYQSPNYDDAPRRVNLAVEAGVSSLVVR